MEVREIEVLKPADLTKSQKKRYELPKYLKKERINAVLYDMPPTKDRMLITFLWMTGVRISEALSVKKQDIDFQNKVITIKWLKSRKYLRRNVPMHSQLLPLLLGHVQWLKAEDLIFPISRQRAFQITKKWLGCSPHQLRHSFAVNWLLSKGDVYMLNRVMGHARLQMTMEYLKIVPMDQAQELEKISFW